VIGKTHTRKNARKQRKKEEKLNHEQQSQSQSQSQRQVKINEITFFCISTFTKERKGKERERNEGTTKQVFQNKIIK
jgi:mannitol-specific phosphotransferase system IIBC component